MPVAVTATEREWVSVELTGAMTLEDVRAAIPKVEAQLREPRLSIFVDTRGITKPLRILEVAATVNLLRRFPALGVKRIAVITGGGIAHEISKAFAAFASVLNLRVKVFVHGEDARVWLSSSGSSGAFWRR